MTEDILRLALAYGLTPTDFKHFTIGMIIDFLTEAENKKVTEKDDVYATQADIDAF